MWRSASIRRQLVRRGVDLVLLAVIAIVALTANAEIVHLGGVQLPKRGEESVALTVTPAILGVDRWQPAAVGLKEGGGAYEVTIVDDGARQLFKLKVDATTGQPLEKERATRAGTPLRSEEIRRAVAALSPTLHGAFLHRHGSAHLTAD